MKEKKITAYFCSYCNKLYQRKHACINHEGICFSNPDNFRACYGCDFLSKKTTMHYFDTYSGESYEKVSLLFCSKKGMYVYPPKVEHGKKWFDLGDEINEPMVKKCDEFKNEY